jgi:hypothetical protein
MSLIAYRKAADVTVAALTDIYRLKAGLSPYHSIEEVTLGFDKLGDIVDPLLNDKDSAFAVIAGDYGSGKTHTLHLVRLLASRSGFAVTTMSPVQGPSILGNPQRLVSSLIDGMECNAPDGRLIDARGLFNKLWTASEGRRLLMDTLTELEADSEPVSLVAREAKVYAQAAEHSDEVSYISDYIFGLTLANKGSNTGTRERAYGLLGLWSRLFQLHYGVRGLIVLFDEVETLFRPHVCPSIASRRAAYRTLAGFLGGRFHSLRALFAITPDGLQFLEAELEGQLAMVACMQSTSYQEDTRKFLLRFQTATVHSLSQPTTRELLLLGKSLRALHLSARGPTLSQAQIDAEAIAAIRNGTKSPRAFTRRMISRLEGAWQASSRY